MAFRLVEAAQRLTRAGRPKFQDSLWSEGNQRCRICLLNREPQELFNPPSMQPYQ